MGEEYEVKRPAKLTDEDGNELDGSSCHESRVLEIGAHLAPHEAWGTLFHEMAHAWIRSGSIKQLLSITDEQEEGIVLSIERHFAHSILDTVGLGAMLRPIPKVIPAQPAKKAARAKRKKEEDK